MIFWVRFLGSVDARPPFARTFDTYLVMEFRSGGTPSTLEPLRKDGLGRVLPCVKTLVTPITRPLAALDHLVRKWTQPWVCSLSAAFVLGSLGKVSIRTLYRICMRTKCHTSVRCRKEIYKWEWNCNACLYLQASNTMPQAKEMQTCGSKHTTHAALWYKNVFRTSK